MKVEKKKGVLKTSGIWEKTVSKTKYGSSNKKIMKIQKIVKEVVKEKNGYLNKVETKKCLSVEV